jgi:ABC-type multidrug transport system ATPase subunit
VKALPIKLTQIHISSRRFVWRHIDAIKEGRVILLTTHAMEEADLLADEVAIMRQGELAAFGSPLQLKTEHGSVLQFSLIVEKTKITEALKLIQDFFHDDRESVTTESSDAGTIIVKIAALKESSNGEGIEVKTLTDFVNWLDSEESPVSEYGFSNSSLEEVFLKVTNEGEGNLVEVQAENIATASDEEEVEVLDGSFDKLSRFTAKLSARNQVMVICKFFLLRGWTGRSSIGNYVMYGLLLMGSTVLMIAVSWYDNPIPFLLFVIVFMSIILITIIGPVYSDRLEGQFYLMRSQGLLPKGYLGGLCLYAFIIQFTYNLLTLTGVFASPFFRDVVLCDYEKDGDKCYSHHFGQKQVVVYPTVVNFEDEFNGDPVTLSAVRAPGGYGMVFGIAIAATLPGIGYTLSTAFFPGYRLPLVMIMLCTLVVGSLPALPIFLRRSDDFIYDCSNTTDPAYVCSTSIFSRDSVDSQFVDCVGFNINSYTINSYCVTPAASLLSHIGIYQMLSMAYTSKVKFISEPEGYVRDVLIPSLEGEVRCKDDTCSFPFASRLYGLNLLFTLIGGILFILLGLCMAYTLGFPIAPIIRLRHASGRVMDGCKCSRQSHDMKPEDSEDATERSEVSEERAVVEDIVKPILTGYSDDGQPNMDHTSVPREAIQPVITHKLRKVYPTRGGRPPVVALDSLDLHVPKGQVLGLLGKNGAGKTTALKILAGAHDSSGGVGLVAGYDCDVEKISVFERLGNCAQFDVVWSNQSVQRHLEFFAALKGLPKSEIKTTARAVANAVGLGSNEVYARHAGSLSGGMRRRLSIGMALIASPSVVILDEPTTGLDPSTRSSIWSLISSFASNHRSMIITTHLMIEADTLCNRIAIVARGKLVVVGTQQHLKNKFGDGYILQLNLVHSSLEHQERAMNFVRKYLHEDARLGIRQAKTLHVNLPRNIKLERVFRALYSEKRTTEGGINQFLLSQSSLEDVFVSLGD